MDFGSRITPDVPEGVPLGRNYQKIKDSLDAGDVSGARVLVIGAIGEAWDYIDSLNNQARGALSEGNSDRAKYLMDLSSEMEKVAKGFQRTHEFLLNQKD